MAKGQMAASVATLFTGFAGQGRHFADVEEEVAWLILEALPGPKTRNAPGLTRGRLGLSISIKRRAVQ